MTEQSRIVMDRYQVRKTEKQKAAFREWLCGELTKAGYAPQVEEVFHGFFCRNVVAGDPDKAEVLYTAHYDTCSVLPFPNFITPRNLLVYILFNVLLGVGTLAVVFAAEAALILLDAPKLACIFASPVLCAFFIFWMMGGGKANRHTANDNTSGVLTLIETALALPEEARDKVCFIFFDNEEKGLFGSGGFAKGHKDVKANTLCINFDCVSDGDYIQFFPTKRLKKDAHALALLEKAFRGRDGKTVEIVRSFGFYPSDNGSFKRAAGVCALRKSRVWGFYMSRIHTGRDTVLEEENIELLRDGALAYAQHFGAENSG